jgi:DNA repair exonuclease SbcCD ATPase subunit
MKEENSPEFQFNGDDQDPDELYQEEMKDLRVEKLSQRITLFSILLPCILVIILYFGYRDLKGRVSQSQDTGSIEIQRLSGELERISKQFNDKLITFSTTLSSQDKNFETSVSGKLAAIDKNVQALKKNIDTVNSSLKTLNDNLKKTESSLEKLNASKADKENQTAEIAKVYAALQPLQDEVKSFASIHKSLQAASSDIKKLETKLTSDLSRIEASTETSRKEFNQIQTSVNTSLTQKIDKDTFDLELLKIKKQFQRLISQAVATLNQRLDSIQQDLGNKQSQSVSGQKTQTTSSVTSPGAGSKASASESGTIVEQDISE